MITFSEYIADIPSTSGAFSSSSVVQALALNAGLPETFPWLSYVAQNFQQYRFKQLMFTFKSTSGVYNGSNQGLGEVILAPQYNVYDSAPTQKQQMLMQPMAISKVPSEDAILGIELNPNETTNNGLLYVRGGALATTQGNLQQYDTANVYVATTGQSTSGTTLGELWVSYTVCLYKPQLQSSGISPGQAGAYAHYQSTNYANSTPLGTMKSLTDSIGLTVTSTVITLPANAQGNYMLSINWAGAATASLTAPTSTLSSGLTGNAILQAGNNYAINSYSTGASGTGTTFNLCKFFAVTAAPGTAQTITIGTGGTLPGTGTYCDMLLMQVDSNL